VDSQQPLKNLNQFHAQHINVDATASMLACIDHNGYQDAILRDANSMLESYLVPMDFPWMHGEQPLVKNMTFDIDEMPAILGIEDDINTPFERGTFGYGKFETGKNPKGGSPTTNQPDNSRVAARRSSDQGIIELTIIQSPPEEDLHLIDASPLLRQNCGNDNHSSSMASFRALRLPNTATSGSPDDPSDILLDASLPVRQFQFTQAEKKRKIDLAHSKIEKKFVSVRFGSVSSRKSIFEPLRKPTSQEGEGESKESGRYCRLPILVNAILPIEVVNGKHLSTGSAKAISDSLGTYDVRYGASSIQKDDQTGKEDRKRIYTGRTRLIWTKEHASEKRNRVVTSILTGNLLEPSNFRRPRDVRVAVKLNGEMLSHEIWELIPCPKSVLAREPTPPDTSVLVDAGLSDKVINAAIADVCGAVGGRLKRPNRKTPERAFNKKVCFLDSAGYLRRLVRSRTKPSKDSHSLSTIHHDGRTFQTPTFECLPAADGAMRLVCTSTGTLKSCWIPSVTQAGSCTICNVDDDSERIDVCKTCGTIAHVSCCWAKGERSVEGGLAVWQCASCCDTQVASSLHVGNPSRRRSIKVPARFRKEVAEQFDDVPEESPHTLQNRRQCSQCPHLGGAISPEGSAWLHDVCRVWGHSQHKPTVECVYCGQASAVGITKCAGNGCSILFHPMCATLVSKMATATIHPVEDTQSKDLKLRKQQDVYLSTQATLTMMCFNRGKISTLMPVAFCGYHNPLREPTFYGCYPAGELIGESVRIPPNFVKE
jgi:hypothetical protein